RGRLAGVIPQRNSATRLESPQSRRMRRVLQRRSVDGCEAAPGAPSTSERARLCFRASDRSERQHADRALLCETVWLDHQGEDSGKVTGRDAFADHVGCFGTQATGQDSEAAAAASGTASGSALSFGGHFAGPQAACKTEG